MQKNICLTFDEQALISSALIFASRLSSEKLTPKQWEHAQMTLNDVSMSLASGGINPDHVNVICGCLEGVRRYIAKDRFVIRTQREAVMQRCAITMQKLQQAIK
jgi:hypothetical protein